MARKKYCGKFSCSKSSTEESVDENPASEDACTTKQWLTDVTEVLEKPTIALALFVLGVFFIVLASKQVKKCFDLLESFGVVVRPRDGILNNFMAAFVFFFVWLDIILVTWCRRWVLKLGCKAWSYAIKVKASMREVENKEKMNAIKNRKKR